jgi:tetratricopeptide (TPR) repeat protein
MITRLSLVCLVCLLFTAGLAAGDTLSKEQIHTLFSQANDAFRQANSTVDDTDKANSLYEKAILGYEEIIRQGHIENPKLYYNLANAYLLKRDVGRAILNYRCAEKLDKSDSDIQKNLAFARSRRVDKVEIKTEKQILQTLVFWHYDFSMRARFTIACVCFAVFCLGLTVMIWFGRNAPLTAATVVSACLLVCLIGSLAVEEYSQAANLAGVIVSPEVVAYQGDGQNYPPSFKAPLHAGTEFDLIERRPGWFHIKLADGSDGWIPQNAAGIIDGLHTDAVR